MAGITKEEKQKREDARKKIDELFGDIVKVDDKNLVKLADTIDNLDKETSKAKTSGGGKQVEWLKSEIEKLNNKNEELENLLVKKTQDYNNLLQSSKAGVVSGAVMNGIKKIFEDLRANYEGRNPQRVKYTEAKILPLLNKFLELFPELRPKK